MSKGAKLNLAREYPLLQFLWEWKVTTSRALIQKFYSSVSAKRAVNRLRDLEEARFIKSICSRDGNAVVWILADRGFEVVQGDLPPLREIGFKPEHVFHDLLVSSVHLGDWMLNRPKGSDFCTEQQLRRLDLNYFPKWVPATTYHRADGYWLAPYNNRFRCIALEVELKEKPKAEYEVAGSFYEEQRSVANVIWVVKSKTMAGNIHKAIATALNRETIRHNFVDLADYLRLGWAAPIHLGPNARQSVSQTLYGIAWDKAGTTPGCIPTQSHLDLRKTPIYSETYNFPPKTPDFH